MRRPSFDNLLAVAAATAVLLPSACSEDPTAENALSGPMLRFEVVDAHGRQTPSQSRAAGDTTDAPEYTDVFTLQGETPVDTLFLHATVSERADTTHMIGAEIAETRAAPVAKATFYDSFGVLSYVYNGSWSETSCRPDYMYDVEVTKASGWATNYFWPGGGRKVRIFAYAPYNGQGIVLSDKAKAGAPTITYTVPDEVADQKDLMLAVSDELSGKTDGSARLTFRHVLTAVRFTTGNDVLPGKVSKITLKGVYGSAVHTMGSDLWSEYTAPADFRQSLDVTVSGSKNQVITPSEATFMMLPQTLPADASIEVIYTDDLTGIQRTLTASIGGAEWPMGKTVTYRISTSSISVESIFEVPEKLDFTYQGGTEWVSVSSVVRISRPGDPARSAPVPWTAEYVEADAWGGYEVVSRPEWCSDKDLSGEGGSMAAEFTIPGQRQTVVSNSNNMLLTIATSINSTSGYLPYNLANAMGAPGIENTANCYIINAPGIYSLPLVYGNAVKNGEPNPSAYTSSAGGTNILSNFVNHLDAPITDPYIYNNADCSPFHAMLIWQDEKDLVTNVTLEYDRRSLTFEVPKASIRQGNAIVAVCDENYRIMWSWHIWVTDYVPGLEPTVTDSHDPDKTCRDKVVTDYQGVQHTFMGVNLGWCDPEAETYVARSATVRFTQSITGKVLIMKINQLPHVDMYRVTASGNNTYYQFGRKDPMLAGVAADANKPCYFQNPAYQFDGSGEGAVTVGTSIQYPFVFYNAGGSSSLNWCSSSYHNLWNSDNAAATANDDPVVKTIYDPSPVGYRLPAPNAFTGFTFNGEAVAGASYFGSRFNTPYASETDVSSNFGWEFYCNRMTGESGYDTAGGTVFYPAAGCRSSSTGRVSDYTLSGYYWSAGPYSTGNGRGLNFNSASIDPLSNGGYAAAYAVRPVRE